MAKLDPDIVAHLEWLGFIGPKGLVVSAPALVRAGAILERRDAEGQRLLRSCVTECPFDISQASVPYLPDFRLFARTVLGWSFSPKAYVGTAECPVPTELCMPLPDYGELVRPDFAVRELEPKDGTVPWQLVVQTIDPALDFERPTRGTGAFVASPHGRMERLLRQTGVPAGLLFNGRTIRLISAPRGESSGWLDFQVADMLQTAGRPICTALRLLLGEPRLLSLPRAQRLPALLEESRKFQNEVSERLAEQVLHALYELLRGFQAAHDASKGELLGEPLDDNPDEIYRALLTVVLRLVFLLYAEERDMLPEADTFVKYYSLAGLYERLREDAALFPDTMDQRYGAWAQLLVLFRMIHDGAESGPMHLPRRLGVLFDPDRFKFLEGRPSAGVRQVRIEPPLVPDGTIYRALEKLLILDGERISYRALDVEQIGSVYQTMMGFRLETSSGVSVAIRADKRHGAPTVLNLESLLDVAPSKRPKWIHDHADRKLTDRVAKIVARATTIEELHAALSSLIDAAATPDLVPPAAMVLQPSEERRRSGSHYTPRALTEPIVRTTLEPILTRLRGPDGRAPTPSQVLHLKVCDPAIGSGAFLVEACRQLADALVEGWHAHGEVPPIPTDEDEVIFARRLIAQRCLYGVDRNPIAVDIAKVSLWLATLARDHAFTFLDHALRHGDSLVGLSRKQLEAFHWDASKPPLLQGLGLRDALDRVAEHRRLIREADESTPDTRLRDLWDETESALSKARLAGDLTVAAFFASDGAKQREEKRNEFSRAVVNGYAERYLSWLGELRDADLPLAPFHWSVEFPEVFDRENGGFDAIIGNPPFAGKNSVAVANLSGYQDFLKQLHEESHGNADLVAHFFRRAFDLLRAGGAFGLIATNTIAQGDTRSTGLRWICQHGGEIYAATRRVPWPGQTAAVVVSVVHVMKGTFPGSKILDYRSVPAITAFLFHSGGHEEPASLAANAGLSFQGSVVLGMGFTFDDTHADGVATPLAEMKRLIDARPLNREVIFPYIGGEEVNTSPAHAHHRFVINFGERDEEECRQRWPELMAIVQARVKPERMKNKRETRKKYWWRFGETTPALFRAIAGLKRVLVISRISNACAFTFLPAGMVYNEKTVVFPFSTYPPFTTLQSRPHEVWTRFLSSTLKDDLQYTPSACFETFPFPENANTRPDLESAGRLYYQFRGALMIRNNEGLTKTYNRFHDPDEQDPDIMKLRQLHASMDRAVLDAFGWHDIPTKCDFYAAYQIDDDKSDKEKVPSRYRWPDQVRDEVLARLLELNSQRAKDETRSGATAKKRGKRVANDAALREPEPEDLFS